MCNVKVVSDRGKHVIRGIPARMTAHTLEKVTGGAPLQADTDQRLVPACILRCRSGTLYSEGEPADQPRQGQSNILTCMLRDMNTMHEATQCLASQTAEESALYVPHRVHIPEPIEMHNRYPFVLHPECADVGPYLKIGM
jgi:hypothetical protein